MYNTLHLTRPIFGFHSTAAQVVTGLSLVDKRVIITGGNSGIGLETARALASIGAEITLAVRDVVAGLRAAKDITASTGNPHVYVAKLDLADRSSIAAFLKAWKGPLHVLVNNAGVMAIPHLMRTADGFERQLATNHLGHFELSLGLCEALAAGSTVDFKSRVVSVSSSVHFYSPFDFKDPHFQNHAYDPWLAYGQSKTANILFALEANRIWSHEGILVNCLTPGSIPTRLQRYTDGDMASPGRLKTVEQGAANSCLLAACPLLEGVGGLYFSDCVEARVVEQQTIDFSGLAPHAADLENAERLWELSLDMLGKNFPVSFRGSLV